MWCSSSDLYCNQQGRAIIELDMGYGAQAQTWNIETESGYKFLQILKALHLSSISDPRHGVEMWVWVCVGVEMWVWVYVGGGSTWKDVKEGDKAWPPELFLKINMISWYSVDFNQKM